MKKLLVGMTSAAVLGVSVLGIAPALASNAKPATHKVVAKPAIKKVVAKPAAPKVNVPNSYPVGGVVLKARTFHVGSGYTVIEGITSKNGKPFVGTGVAIYDSHHRELSSGLINKAGRFKFDLRLRPGTYYVVSGGQVISVHVTQ